MSDPTPWLHVRPQSRWHGEVSVRGTRAGLSALGAAVALALEDGEAEGSAFASDGEGYQLQVVRCRTVSSLGKPYYVDEVVREMAEQERTFMIRHDKLIRKQNQEALDALRWCRANGNPHKEAP